MRRVVVASGEHSHCAGISSSRTKKAPPFADDPQGCRINVTGQNSMYDTILQAIRQGNISNGDISKATGIPLEKCGTLLRKMRDEGILMNINRGKYTIRPISHKFYGDV